MLGLLPGEQGSELVFCDFDWLHSAVWMSIGTDGRALPDDVLPGNDPDRRGYWGDTYRPGPIGSRMWLLSREKSRPEVAARAEEYVYESLMWLLDEKIAESVTVETRWQSQFVLLVLVVIIKPNDETYRFEYLWSKNNGLEST